MEILARHSYDKWQQQFPHIYFRLHVNSDEICVKVEASNGIRVEIDFLEDCCEVVGWGIISFTSSEYRIPYGDANFEQQLYQIIKNATEND